MTINILKKWENIGENYLDANLEYTQDASKKISLDEAIQKSADIMPDRIEDISSALRAMNEITSRVFSDPNFSDYDTYHKLKKNTATLMINNYFYSEIRDAMELIVQENVEKELRIFQRECNTFPPDVDMMEQKNRFLNERLNDKITQIICENDRSETRGFLYELTNEKNTTSYLIGTLHFLGGEKYLKNTTIKEKVMKSSEFISEIGDLTLQGRRMDIIDDILTRLANSHGAPIHALETMEDRIKARSSYSQKYFTDEGLERKGQLKRFQEYESSNLLVSFDEIDAWEKGDLEKLKKVKQVSTKLTGDKEVRKQRNRNWLNGKRIDLIGKIKNTESSISIAVGASHLFGKTGLLKAFEDQGLKIRQI